MKNSYLLTIASIALLWGCESPKPNAMKELPAHFETQGHRGARGLMPENTIPAFLKALDYDMTTLELDVVVTQDGHLVVSHEPWMNATICTTPSGGAIPSDQERGHNIYAMTLAEVQAYDCGLRPHERFPEQERLAAYKPTLEEVVLAVNEKLAATGRQSVLWNIETKSEEGQDAVYHPAPMAFAQLLYETLQRLDIVGNTTVQSFDPRTLEAMRQLDTAVTLSLLIETDTPQDLDTYLAKLSFQPDILSINYEAVTPKLVNAVHAKGMRIIPWTVNEVSDMRTLISMGVDGLISDYPDRLQAVVGGTAPAQAQ